MSERHIHWHQAIVDRAARFNALGVRGATLWLTGLSGSGKSTIAAAVEAELIRAGLHAYRLDGDNLRTGLNRDLGFSDADRGENVRRLAEVARLLADAGVVAIVGAISPFRADRAMARRTHEADPEGPLPFIEVFVDAPLSVCEERDPKGLYGRARRGELKAFTGIDSPYEPPTQPDVHLRTDVDDVPTCVGKCVDAVRDRKHGPP